MKKSDFNASFKGLFEGSGGSKPTCGQYQKFIKDFNWFHIVSTLANDNYLSLEKVLDENVQDCFAYLQYITAKNMAEQAQMEFEMKNNKTKNK